MSGFHNISLRWKLLGGFGLVLALMLGAGGWSLWQLQQQEAAYSTLVDHQAQAATLAQQLRASFMIQVKLGKDVLLRGDDPEQFTTYAGQFDQQGTDIRNVRAGLERLSGDLTVEEGGLIQRFDAGWTSYLDNWSKAKVAYGGPGGGRFKDADAIMRGKDRDAAAAADELATRIREQAEEAHGALQAA